jgi:hypothetical protein
LNDIPRTGRNSRRPTRDTARSGRRWLGPRRRCRLCRSMSCPPVSPRWSPLIERWNVTRIRVSATDPSPALRFEHRAFLKWALETSQTTALQHCVACRDSWCADEIWPCCGISWYRGWVLWPVDETGAMEHSRAAYSASAVGTSNSVMMLVAARLRCGAAETDHTWHAAPADLSQALARHWPSEANTPTGFCRAEWSHARARARPMDFR